METDANSYQIGGSHYQGAEYQCWDFLADIYGQSYFKAQIVRYIARWRKKNGEEDVRKALHYVSKLRELSYHGLKICSEGQLSLVSKLYEVGGVEVADASIIADTLGASSLKDVDALFVKISNLLPSKVEEFDDDVPF